jgi:hypothetical protein
MWKYANTISSILILVLMPLGIAWWLFIPFSIITVFVSRNIYAPIAAAFLLDLLYLGRYPFFLLGSSILALLFLTLSGRIRALS